MKYNHNYSQTMMMKLLLAEPDHKGGCKMWYNFEDALKIIEQVDYLTFGAPKIIYLVGWQYLGHDDKYPAFFEVNEHIKRAEDNSARDSLLWLIDNAKKYNTTVSLHINFSDAYPDSPLWQEYIDNDLILRRGNGSIKCTGTWGGEKAYQVRFAAEVKSGYFKKRADMLMDLLPLRELGTLHVDAFFVRKGKNTTIASEKAARKQMVEYFNANGVDITSEFIYREWRCGHRAHTGRTDCVGLIPAFWNPVFSRRDVTRYQADELAGGRQCNSLTFDKSIEWLFYGNIQGEDLFKAGEGWQEKFFKQFATINLPYFFLNQQKRLSVKGQLGGRVCNYSGSIRTCIKGKKIYRGDQLLKSGDNLCLPLHYRKNAYLAYSSDASSTIWHVDGGSKAKIYLVDKDKLNFLQMAAISDGKINYNTSKDQGYYIEIVE